MFRRIAMLTVAISWAASGLALAKDERVSTESGAPDTSFAGETVIVTTTDDVTDFGGAQQVADLPGPDGRVSFREACIAANNTPGPQTIAFNIPITDPGFNGADFILRLDHGIFPLNDDGTTVDFLTQTDFTGDTNPDGTEVGIYGFEPNAWGVAAIYIFGSNCTIRGLGRVMQRGYAVRIPGNNNRVVGCVITGPWYAGVYITGGWEGPIASGNVVGGTEPGEGNYLSGGDDGVRIDGPAADNIVIGNTLVGSFSGASIRSGATNNRIGGPTPAERNVISGSGHSGEEGYPVGTQVELSDADDNIIEGNYIGLTADGMSAAFQIGPTGIRVHSSNNTIIRNNVIGGIAVDGSFHAAGQRFGIGIEVRAVSTGTVIEGNLIGTDALGLGAVPNYRGVVVQPWYPPSDFPTDVRIGGAEPGQANVIAYNEIEGVFVSFNVHGVNLSRNSIFDNEGLGISVNAGGNGDQAAPTIAEATSDGVTSGVLGSVVSAPNSTVRVEVFSNATCDPSGAGEGETFLGDVIAQTNPGGFAAFQLVLPIPLDPGVIVTATATELATGNSSEFSVCHTVVAGSVPTDADGDGVPDSSDNCPALFNPAQADCDNDGVGDACAIADGFSEDCDGNGLPDECEIPTNDCNGTGTLDACDVSGGISADCNGNGTPDECELTTADCNGNAVPDDCDLAAGTSADCDGSGVPDECEVAANDCNGNGVIDACDIANGTSEDCNFNGTPDECENNPQCFNDFCEQPFVMCTGTVAGTTAGATNDGSTACSFATAAPDVWYSYTPSTDGVATISTCGSAADTVLSVHTGCPGTPANELACNDDACGVFDSSVTISVVAGQTYIVRVTTWDGLAGDFNLTIVGPECGPPPPECTVDADCDDGNPCTDDTCDAQSTCVHTDNAAACDDGDTCTTLDTCSGGVCVGGPPACTGVGCDDCNANGRPDECDINDGTSTDANGNGVPDECDIDPTPSAVAEGPRYVAVTPAAIPDPVALIVSGTAGDPLASCLSRYVQTDGTLGVDAVFQMPATWGTVHVHDSYVLPGTTYAVQAEFGAGGTPFTSAPAMTTTWRWGDVDNNGTVNFLDIGLVVRGFQGDFSAAPLETVDLEPCLPNGLINFSDVSEAVRAFQGLDILCPPACANAGPGA